MPHPSKSQAPVPRSKLHNPVNGPEHARKKTNKKNGAGSNNWGRVGDEYDDAPSAFLDTKDPNYDPEEAEAVMEASSWS